MNNEDFVTYKTAVKLKELGFDWECAAYYHSGFSPEGNVAFYKNNSIDDHNHRGNPRVYSAPTLALAQKWLREKHGWQIIITPHRWKGLVFDYILWHTMRGYENKNQGYNFSSYESALAAGIDAALKLIEDSKS